jgi:hypothetical protein
VLLADLNPNDARVIVAHDGAVPPLALVTAASGGTGVSASIVRGGRIGPPAEAGEPNRVVAWFARFRALFARDIS